MVGLNARHFYEHLKSRDGIFLYCTEVSRLLLSADEEYRHLEKYIRVLDVGTACHICVPGNQEKEDVYVRVTPISAGHCLGSVMFLFEGTEGNVLYTGDFRWEVDQSAKITELRNGNSIIDIKALYIDTTFCVPEAIHIPSRNECVEAAYTLISSWLAKGLCNVVSISCPARFGHEHLLLEIAKRLKTKVHVPEWKVGIYEQIPELQGFFTVDASESLIHCCSTTSGFTKTSVLPCGYRRSSGERMKLLNIRPSTMWFTSTKTKSSTTDLVVAPARQRGLHRVCYSMHSSYSEIRDLVSFIRPERVYPNVLPASDTDMAAVRKRLERFIDHPNKFRLKRATGDVDVLQPLGTLKKMPQTALRFIKGDSFESGSDDLIFSSQELSPCKISTTQPHAKGTGPSPGKECQSSLGTRRSPDCHVQDVSFESQSSYSGSGKGQEDEIDLFSDEEKEENDDIVKEEKTEESLRLYISGESEPEESDHEDDKEEVHGLALDTKYDSKSIDPSASGFNKGDICKTSLESTQVYEYENTIKNDLKVKICDVETEAEGYCYKNEFEGKEAEHLDFSEKIKKCSSDEDDDNENDVIPNSQETTDVNTTLHRKKLCSTSSNNYNISKDQKKRMSQQTGKLLSKEENNCNDTKSYRSIIEDNESNVRKNEINLVNQCDGLVDDCEIIDGREDRNKSRNEDIVILDANIRDITEECETEINAYHDKPSDTKSSLNNLSFQKSPDEIEKLESPTISEIINVDEDKIVNQDTGSIEFLYEENMISGSETFPETGKTSGWLSKTSGAKSHRLISSCYSRTASQSAKAALKTLDIPYKRKIETVEDIDLSWCSKSQKKGENAFKTLEKNEPHKELNTNRQSNVVDLTLEDSDTL